MLNTGGMLAATGKRPKETEKEEKNISTRSLSDSIIHLTNIEIQKEEPSIIPGG